jgi:hypothetical protein
MDSQGQFGNAGKYGKDWAIKFKKNKFLKYLYSTYYTIGGHLYSLQSIFNGILRGNRKGLGMLWKPFGEQDLRKDVRAIWRADGVNINLSYFLVCHCGR